MLVYLIGPSGAGKTTTADGVIQQRCDVKHVDLDELIREKRPDLFSAFPDGWQVKFWCVAKKCIEELGNHDGEGIILIDCGAGCLGTEIALKFFQTQENVVALIGSHDILFKRAVEKPGSHWKTRCLADYEQMEFSALREKFYNAAKYKVDVSKPDAVGQLLDILNQMTR